MTILGSRIEKERTGCGLSREELAQQLHVKTTELISWEEVIRSFTCARSWLKFCKFPANL